MEIEGESSVKIKFFFTENVKGLMVRDGHTGTRHRRKRRAEVEKGGIAVQVLGWDCDE